MYDRVKELFNQAATNLQDWIFSFSKMNYFISTQETVVKVLVLIWNTDPDMLQAVTNKFKNTEIVTAKIQVLSTMACLFDPLRLITSAKIKIKLFLQML